MANPYINCNEFYIILCEEFKDCEQQREMAKLVLIYAIFIIINFCSVTYCFTCGTPDEWLNGVAESCDPFLTYPISPESFGPFLSCPGFQVRNGEKWARGVVPYIFHSSFTLKDVSEARKAFEEYESKTCIRFQPWKEGDRDYVSLEFNQSLRECGMAQVCKQGGYQFAQIGNPNPDEDCRNKATIVHELGHTICLGHEHQRWDRDKYLDFSGCLLKPRKLERNGKYTTAGIYDYSSQMHYGCHWCGGGWPKDKGVTKCGTEVGLGLSPLDADQINRLYDCQGCHRHRWHPTYLPFGMEKANLYNFGYTLKDGTPLYPCRAPFRSGVYVGRFDTETNSCHIAGRSQTHVITEDVEVLTIPGGLNNKCSVYKLRDKAEVTRENGIVSAVSFKYTEARGYIAYGSLRVNGATENAIGKVWLRNNTSGFNDTKAELQTGSINAFKRNYKVLTCSLDETCLLQESCKNREASSGGEPKKIVCYVNSWAMNYEGDGKFFPEDADPHLCTHLIYYSAKLENNVITASDPLIDLQNEYGNGHGMSKFCAENILDDLSPVIVFDLVSKGGYQRITNLRKRNPKVKILIAIGPTSMFDTWIYSQMAGSFTARSVFVDSIIPFLERHGFDGLDLFWLHPTADVGEILDDSWNFSRLVEELRTAFSKAGKGYLLTAALRHSMPYLSHDIPKLGRNLDFISVRSYAFTDTRQVTRHISPMYRHPDDVTYLALSNVNDTIHYWLHSGLPKEKLIMGMPLQGMGFTLVRAENHGIYAPATGHGFSVWGYNSICKLFLGGGWKISINKMVKAPYTFKGHQWIGYEDVESLYRKAEYARNMDLGGAMLWYLDTDDFKGNCHNEPYILLKTVVTMLNGPRIPQRPNVVPEDA